MASIQNKQADTSRGEEGRVVSAALTCGAPPGVQKEKLQALTSLQLRRLAVEAAASAAVVATATIAIATTEAASASAICHAVHAGAHRVRLTAIATT